MSEYNRTNLGRNFVHMSMPTSSHCDRCVANGDDGGDTDGAFERLRHSNYRCTIADSNRECH